jgi:hypothetical protein
MAGALEDFAPDVVHLASPAVLGAQAAFTARRLGLPVVAVYQTDLGRFRRPLRAVRPRSGRCGLAARGALRAPQDLAPIRHAVASCRATACTA